MDAGLGKIAISYAERRKRLTRGKSMKDGA